MQSPTQDDHDEDSGVDNGSPSQEAEAASINSNEDEVDEEKLENDTDPVDDDDDGNSDNGDDDDDDDAEEGVEEEEEGEEDALEKDDEENVDDDVQNMDEANDASDDEEDDVADGDDNEEEMDEGDEPEEEDMDEEEIEEEEEVDDDANSEDNDSNQEENNDNEEDDEEDNASDSDSDSEDDEQKTIEQLASEKHTEDDTPASSPTKHIPSTAITSPAYALLAGMVLPSDPKTNHTNYHTNDAIHKHNNHKLISIPLPHIPAILGREHATKDVHFIGLENSKQVKLLSKFHCSIFYRDEYGGYLGSYGTDNGVSGTLNGMTYVPQQEVKEEDTNDKSSTAATTTATTATTIATTSPTIPPENIMRLPGMKPDDPLPKGGFFVIHCHSPHKIRVGGKWVKKGQQAMLSDGISIQIASYCLYFLLPKSTPPRHSIRVEVPDAVIKKHEKVKVKEEKDKKGNVETSPTKKKRKMKKVKKEVKEEAADQEEMEDDNAKSDNDQKSNNDDDDRETTKPPTKKSRKSDDNFALQLEKLPTRKLLSLLAQVAESDTWDRNDQLVGSALAIRAVRAAARSKQIQTIATTQDGVSQREILDWLNDANNTFKDYERIMLSKIERKSFLTSVGKAIVRAGFVRNDSNPRQRAHRWDLPKDIEVDYEGMVESPVGSPRKSPGSGGVKSPKLKKKTEAGGSDDDNDDEEEEEEGGVDDTKDEEDKDEDGEEEEEESEHGDDAEEELEGDEEMKDGNDDNTEDQSIVDDDVGDN